MATFHPGAELHVSYIAKIAMNEFTFYCLHFTHDGNTAHDASVVGFLSIWHTIAINAQNYHSIKPNVSLLMEVNVSKSK